MNTPENSVELDTLPLPIQVPVPFTSNANDDVIGTAVTYFCMTPSTESDDWKTVVVPTGVSSLQDVQEPIDIDSLKYEFESLKGADAKQEALEPYQKAVLIIDINPACEQWTFSGEGIEFCGKPSEKDCKIKTKVSTDCKQLTLLVDHVTTDVSINFCYLAAITKACGKLEEYKSKDPSVRIGRAKV
jgi:hypothetical protein